MAMASPDKRVCRNLHCLLPPPPEQEISVFKLGKINQKQYLYKLAVKELKMCNCVKGVHKS